MMSKRIFIVALCVLLNACTANKTTYQAQEDTKKYTRGTSNYNAGTATVTQQDVNKLVERNFDGIRVAGSDTDIEPEYWDSILRVKGERLTFNIFRNRYKDLIVKGSDAQDAALKEFRLWAKSRSILDSFNSYWVN
ncbi:MAG: hypothetical protein ACRBHB_11090 [Arenicella sp.]